MTTHIIIVRWEVNLRALEEKTQRAAPQPQDGILSVKLKRDGEEVRVDRAGWILIEMHLSKDHRSARKAREKMLNEFMAGEKEKMEVKINSLEDKNKRLENTVSTLITKLERLEKVALNESKSQDLATIKLP